jgi:hypothetical protein
MHDSARFSTTGRLSGPGGHYLCDGARYHRDRNARVDHDTGRVKRLRECDDAVLYADAAVTFNVAATP